ncbi:hypothetical protein DFH06DRAFT_1345696 [Mycena polygramma]|nr:hypothetical protein DFH06DRAFT_1345696 [Mycena polygramma]
MKLHAREIFWTDQFIAILKAGYRLGNRYDPNKLLSWKKADTWPTINYMATTNVAWRLQDNLQVVLKRVGREELDVVRHLQSLPQIPRNHTIPLLDEICLKDEESWRHLSSCHGLAHSIPLPNFNLSGIDFLHEHKIAHRDVCPPNFVEDKTELVPAGANFRYPSLAPDGKRTIRAKSRSQVTVAYYIIDFELSLVNPGLATGIVGQDISAPELHNSGDGSYDPFKLDIYCFGNMILSKLKPNLPELDWTPLLPLLDSMTHKDPRHRPTSASVGQQLKLLREVHPIGPPDLRKSPICGLLRRLFRGS